MKPEGKRGKTVLVIEDDRPLRAALVEKLGHSGFTTIEAENGEVGLEQCFRDWPDLILLDIVMPKMDGMAMLKQLRDDERGAEVPVVLLTNYSEVEMVTRATLHRAADYLIKADWKLEDVVAKVAEVLADQAGSGRQ